MANRGGLVLGLLSAGLGFGAGLLVGERAGVAIPQHLIERHKYLEIEMYGHEAHKPIIPTLEEPLVYTKLNHERLEGFVEAGFWGTYALDSARGGILVLVSGIFCHEARDGWTDYWFIVSRLDPLGVRIRYKGKFVCEMVDTGIPEEGMLVPGLYLKPLGEG